MDYNREDTVNLATLMETVADRLHDVVYSAAVDGSAAETRPSSS